MPEGSLEELVINLVAIPVSFAIVLPMGYGFCAVEAVIKGAYRKIRGDPRPFKELYRENLLIGKK